MLYLAASQAFAHRGSQKGSNHRMEARVGLRTEAWTRSTMWRTAACRASLRSIAPPVASRGLAKKASQHVDLGWDEMRAELTRVPLEVPELKMLLLTHCRRGAGHSGAQKFVKAFIAPFRYQNPDASISAVGLQPKGAPAKPGETSTMLVELKSGQKHEFQVKGMQTTEILTRVLETAGMPEGDVARAIEAATPPPPPKLVDGFDAEADAAAGVLAQQ